MLSAFLHVMSAATARSEHTPRFIAELDGLRGIAILAVMVHRFCPDDGSLVR